MGVELRLRQADIRPFIFSTSGLVADEADHAVTDCQTMLACHLFAFARWKGGNLFRGRRNAQEKGARCGKSVHVQFIVC